MLEKTQIQTLLPHQGPMFLLDRVIRYDREEILCRASSHGDAGNPLRRQGVLPIEAGIEYAAQAAGVHGGLLNRDTNPSATPQRGYLAVLTGVEWRVERLDDLSEPLFIQARRVAVTPGGRLYKFRVAHAEVDILWGELVIALESR